MVPPTYRDERGLPIEHPSFELTRDVLLQALDDMSAALVDQGVTVHGVTVGGAVNTVHLRSRPGTHDIDFFLPRPDDSEHRALIVAARHVNRRSGGALGAEWFNNATQLLIGAANQSRLASAAFEQNAVVYDKTSSARGLRLSAAPWPYAISAKLARISTARHRAYDMEDAVRYLGEYLRLGQQRSVSARGIRRWESQHGHSITDEVLRSANASYNELFGSYPISFEESS